MQSGGALFRSESLLSTHFQATLATVTLRTRATCKLYALKITMTHSNEPVVIEKDYFLSTVIEPYVKGSRYINNTQP